MSAAAEKRQFHFGKAPFAFDEAPLQQDRICDIDDHRWFDDGLDGLFDLDPGAVDQAYLR
ncbi:hypothetical protein [Bradyrhizobium sp. Cp5.3]|uniref:hypothetical protein n=1 Tax=Bradyrhizobium sp. Cp5.3 TaxID=443598 RepID=UPI0012ECA67D|nr:hypothetical protein [Bradyrhizobium sp. Cp5.3]